MKSAQPFLDIVNRKIYSATKTVKEKTKELPKEIDEEYHTLNVDFKSQQSQFQSVMTSLSNHLQSIKNAPQDLLNVGDAFLEMFNKEDDIYNHVLQFRSSCQIRQMAEDDYAAAYEILYSNAHSCIVQYLELKERKKVFKNRKIDWELAVKRVSDMKKKKNQKGLDELLEKEEFANFSYHQLRDELIKDMCLMMNMVVKYRTVLFKAVVELEMKRKDGLSEALSIISRFGGEEGATPEYVITEIKNSFISEVRCYETLQKRKRGSTTPLMSPKQAPAKNLPKVPSKQLLMSQEIKMRNEIINGIKKEIEQENLNKIKKVQIANEKYEAKQDLPQKQNEVTDSVIETEKATTPAELKNEVKNEIINDIKKVETQENVNPFDTSDDSEGEYTSSDDSQISSTPEDSSEICDPAEAPVEGKQEPKEEPTTEPKVELKVEEKVELKDEPKDESKAEEQKTIENNEIARKEETNVTKNANDIVIKPQEIPVPNKPILAMKVLYDYEAADKTELSIREGDIINIYDNSGDWWMAELNGKKGLVPANFIDFIK